MVRHRSRRSVKLAYQWQLACMILYSVMCGESAGSLNIKADHPDCLKIVKFVIGNAKKWSFK